MIVYYILIDNINMKTLKEVLENGCLDVQARALYNEKRFMKHFGDYWWMIEEDFKQEPFKDYITEMLQSHDADKLIKFLQERVFTKIDKNIKVYKETPGKLTNIVIEFSNFVIGDCIEHNKDFKQLLFYFNYYITLREKLIIKLEPKITDKADDFIYNKCCGMVYHITEKEKLESILKRGLRPKEGQNYRYFPEKIFLFATENFKYPKKRDEDLKKFAQSIQHTGSKYVVLLIRFPWNLHREIYCDKSLDGNYAYYTFDDIPPQLIKVYKDVDKL